MVCGLAGEAIELFGERLDLLEGGAARRANLSMGRGFLLVGWVQVVGDVAEEGEVVEVGVCWLVHSSRV